VYWLLNAPFVDIVALYSNAAENPGFISGTIPGPAQKSWLIQTLKTIAAERKAKPQERKALILATHHPPYTAGGHSPSTEMLADIDDACNKAGLMPDMFLSGHAHSYQRYTRDLTFNGRALQIPYLVAGIGGINDQAVHSAAGKPKTGDHTFESSLQGYGYLLVEANATTLTATMYQVDVKSTTIPKKKSQFDQVKVDLAHGTVS